MTVEMMSALNNDLANEYSHMLFYAVHASTLVGPHRETFSKFFRDHAASEMAHAIEFQELIVGLGGVPAPAVHPVPVFSDVEAAVKHAITLEEEVTDNYVKRLAQAEAMGGPDGLRVKLFIEAQFYDSRKDLDHLRNLIVRVGK